MLHTVKHCTRDVESEIFCIVPYTVADHEKYIFFSIPTCLHLPSTCTTSKNTKSASPLPLCTSYVLLLGTSEEGSILQNNFKFHNFVKETLTKVNL